MRDKASWSEAARNDPASLSLDEFLAFRHPESSHANILTGVEEVISMAGDNILTGVEEVISMTGDNILWCGGGDQHGR